MLDTAYIITWREVDGSGSGGVAAFADKARAEFLLKALQADVMSRTYRLEAVPFDATAAVAQVVAAPKTKRQYFYSEPGCAAKRHTDADCICWHDEGTGPATSLAPEMLEWREVPAC